MKPGLFRVARQAGPVRNLIKTAIQVVIVWTVALGVLPAIAVGAEAAAGFDHPRHPVFTTAGIVVFLAGSTTGIWSAAVMAVRGEGTPVPFDAARALVVAGPYRVVRNPMACSAIVQLTGVGVALASPTTLALAVAGAVVWHVVIRPPEERFLADRFGAEYERYRAGVRLWVPSRPWRPT